MSYSILLLYFFLLHYIHTHIRCICTNVGSPLHRAGCNHSFIMNLEFTYVYKVCPSKEATQVDEHSTTNLGQWDKFSESYGIMFFSIGDKCWNGPYRSLKGSWCASIST